MSETKREYKVVVRDTRAPVGERVKVVSIWATTNGEAEKSAIAEVGGTDAVSLGPTGRRKPDAAAD